MKRGLIVFGHGSRDPLWVQTLVVLGTRVRAAMPDMDVELAYLEFIHPTLAECVEILWRRGCRDITVLPAFVAGGAHLRHEMPQLMEQAGSGHDGLSMQLLPAMGDLPEVQDAVVRYLESRLGT